MVTYNHPNIQCLWEKKNHKFAKKKNYNELHHLKKIIHDIPKNL